jgi:hypothetical protein
MLVARLTISWGVYAEDRFQASHMRVRHRWPTSAADYAVLEKACIVYAP